MWARSSVSAMTVTKATGKRAWVSIIFPIILLYPSQQWTRFNLIQFRPSSSFYLPTPSPRLVVERRTFCMWRTLSQTSLLVALWVSRVTSAMIMPLATENTMWMIVGRSEQCLFSLVSNVYPLFFSQLLQRTAQNSTNPAAERMASSK